jgi:azurin
MKNFLRSIPSLTLALLVTAIPFPAHAEDEKKVAISGSDQMKYDVTAIEAAVGQKVTITLTNAGKLPKEAMSHNIVILKPGTDFTAFATAAMTQAANGYIAPEQADKVIVKSKLLGPGESDTITFTVTAAGTYDYLCTFPGHVMAGMHGTITVK